MIASASTITRHVIEGILVAVVVVAALLALGWVCNQIYEGTRR